MSLRFQIWAAAACYVAFFSFGCASSGTASAPAHPDRAALVVTVKAEPKKGWHDPKTDSAYAGLADIGAGRQFETIDYETLNEIVVWVRVSDETHSPFAPLVIDPTKPDPALRVISTGTPLLVQPAHRDVFLRTEAGNVMSLSGGSVPKLLGYVEVLADPNPQPVARLYIVPGPYVSMTESGRPVRFDNLPPGPARVIAWHPRLPGSQAEVSLVAGKTAPVALKLGVNSLPKAP